MKTDNIFKFLNVRPVQRAQGKFQRFAGYGAAAKSPLHQQIADLPALNARTKALALAEKHLASADYVATAQPLMLRAVEAAAAAATNGKARDAAKAVLGTDLTAWLGLPANKKLKDQLWDSLYAQTLMPEAKPNDRETVFKNVRGFFYLESLATAAVAAAPMRLDKVLNLSPLIPSDLIPPAGPSPKNPARDKALAEIMGRLDGVVKEVTELQAAAMDLRNAGRIYKAAEKRKFVKQVDPTPGKFMLLESETLAGVTITGQKLDPATDEVGGKIMSKTTIIPALKPWVFDEFGKKNLAAGTQKLLTERSSAVTELHAPEVIVKLEAEAHAKAVAFLETVPSWAASNLAAAPAYASLLSKVHIPFVGLAPAAITSAQPLPPLPGSASARGIRPLGMGDLLVVKQELLRYKEGEVAHIENVLKSEKKVRTHLRLRETEEITITETEQLEESEKDLQTTERFELQKEAQSSIETTMALDAGISVSGGFGPVTVTSHADFALTTSTAESNKTASNFAREVTERSISKIMQRARAERTRRTLERFEEKNEHILDNTKEGASHITGIYRWVDKYYKARVINYGRRLMMEFIVPEPAAFYLHLTTNRPVTGVSLPEPKFPTINGQPLQPEQLDRSNYTAFISAYNVQDVEAYPDERIEVGAALAGHSPEKDTYILGETSEKLVVPPGYQVSAVWGEVSFAGPVGHGIFVSIGGGGFGGHAAGLQGIVPIAVNGSAWSFAINVRAVCDLKEDARDKWKLKTYTAIMNAYERALAAYNEQVATAQIRAGVAIEGRNPELNRKLERDELRKGALRVVTNNFAETRVGGVTRIDEAFDAMKDNLPNSTFGYPEFDVAEAITEGRIIQFFEQAFDWNNMTYRFYPYFWGRKQNWHTRYSLTDPDPLFTDFLRSGSARVIVPVHPAYAETVLHYLHTNEIWNGGTPPTIDDPLFVSIVDELKSDTGADINGDLPVCALDSPYPCIVEEWEMKLPTTLVYLQQDSALPNGANP